MKALALPLFILMTAAVAQLVEHGSMHETIGNQKHGPRVAVADLIQQPHFFGVGAVSGLAGEITIADSKAFVTKVDANGVPNEAAAADVEATLFVGQTVASWTEIPINEPISPDVIDTFIANQASERGLDSSEPFVFVINGPCTHVKLHVINGACPVRARMMEETLPSSQKPYELESETLKGTVVGVYAKDAAGKLTHHGTSQHAHLLYQARQDGGSLTGHLERYGLAKGAVLKLPKLLRQPD